MHLLRNKTIFTLHICIIILTIISSYMGLFYNSDGTPFEVASRYGDTVRMYGQGLYTYDSYFKAAISRGTDFTFLFVVVPLLLAALLYDHNRSTAKSRILLLSGIGCVLYYSASYALGVSYNLLFLVYIILFSMNLFCFIFGITELKKSKLSIDDSRLPLTSIMTFLTISSIALIIAWLPDIIIALIKDKPIALIEIYTTEITYILDMGIISPALFITLILVKRRQQLGYILLNIFLLLCTVIGITVCLQTIFQMQAGINLTTGEIITKVAIFAVLAVYSSVLEFSVIKSIKV